MRLPQIKHGRPTSLKSLNPGYFALVMATGIVAIALHVHGIPVLPTVLFCLNAVFLTGLVVVTILRVRYYPAYFLGDIRSHKRGVGFFTLVAAMGVFGSQIVIQFNAPLAALPFWCLTVVLWFIVMYGILTALTAQEHKPTLAAEFSGSWLISVVATESLSILTTLVLPAAVFDGLRQTMIFAALALWLVGGALYIWIVTLVFFRYMFRPMAAKDYTAPYWINMGAVAISTLGGIRLLQEAAQSPLITELVPFIEGFTLLHWAVGTWWIPMLLCLGFWRYIIRGAPLVYEPQDWGGVFPLAMYAVCTYRLAEVVNVAFLIPLSWLFTVIAGIAWLAAFIGLVDTRLHARES